MTVLDDQTVEVQQPPATWVDVARTLAQLDPSSDTWGRRPQSLVRARVDWLGLSFEFAGVEVPRAEVLAWLEQVFPQRIAEQNGLTQIILEAPVGSDRLSVELEPGAHVGLSQTPLGTVEGVIEFQSASSTREAVLPLVACHSVKGGNGRTTTAIACAVQWAEQAGGPVLIVDADIEAPGLSYLYRSSRGLAAISLEDVVAFAHADDSVGRSRTADFVASLLADQRLGDIYVLPLRRNLDELASSSIRAEHLSSPESPFALADLLREVGRRLECVGVVVDIRAGLVPLAAQLMLDPSVNRIFVSSLAGQSLEGTSALIRYVSREARRRHISLSQPMLVINRIPSILRETGADDVLLEKPLDQITFELLKGRAVDVGGDESLFQRDDEIEPIAVVKIPEISDLQATSPRWEGFVDQVKNSGFLKRLSGELVSWLQKTSVTGDGSSILRVSSVRSNEPIVDRDAQAKRLKAFADRLIAAEVAAEPVDTPLVTGALRSLAEQFTAHLPIVVAEGAKGTGKTLTARFLVARKHWSEAVTALVSTPPKVDAPILPVLGSIQASESFQTEIDARRAAIAKELGFGEPQTAHATVAYLRSELSRVEADEERAKIWLNAIAWSCGFEAGSTLAGEGLVKELREKRRSIVAVIEGVEELYVDPFQGTTPAWLRSLLVDLPQRLRGEPSRPIGLIVFARRDSVDAAVPQNSNQFRSLYQSFALTWSDQDVLELAAWVATRSGALSIWSPAFRSLGQDEREVALHPLWGRKLGPDDRPTKRTAEAYTANWVVAVLSDLQSRLVARDLVRLLDNAAENSVGVADVEYIGTRLLTPRALKDAVKPTSVEKVRETQEEISELRPVFDKFRRKPDAVVAPLDENALKTLELTETDISLLQRHGILFGDAPPYEVPELFRMGLNLRHSGARHSVINLRRRARLRLGLPIQ